MTWNAAIEYAFEIFRANEVPYSIATQHEAGSQRAVIVLGDTWRAFGICEGCGGTLEDRRYKLCERCRNE